MLLETWMLFWRSEMRVSIPSAIAIALVVLVWNSAPAMSAAHPASYDDRLSSLQRDLEIVWPENAKAERLSLDAAPRT